MSFGLPDRVLAEAVIAWERIDPNLPTDHRADEAALQAGGDFEQRVITRARLSVAPALTDALRHVRQAIALMILAGIVLGMGAGAATARAALGSPRDEPANFFFALGTVLGPQTIFLLFWLGLTIVSWRRGGGLLSIASFGGLIVRLAQRVAARLHKNSHHAAAVAAISSVYLRGSIGKWSLSAISHTLWLAFNIGCLTVVILLLSTRQYTFAWETTILSKDQYRPIIKAIAAAPRFLGFAAPTDDQINSSQWDTASGRFAQGPETRRAWSSLLVGCIVVYGFAPRLLLVGWCLGQLRQARQRYRLDTDSHELLRLQSRLMPVSHRLGLSVSPAGNGHSLLPHVRTQHEQLLRQRPFDSPAIVGFEITSGGAVVWPPPVHAVRWLDLGFVEGGDDQRRVLKQIADAPSQPSAIVVVCNLTATPDRGSAAFFADLGRTVAAPLSVLLTGGQAMRRRLSDPIQLERRIADWRTTAVDAGVESQRIIELDLDHWTNASSAKLATLLDSQGSAGGRAAQRQIENAFELIASNASHWNARGVAATAAEQAELHRQIGRLYREQDSSWRDLLGATMSLGTDLPKQLRHSADRVIRLLPQRLSLQPRWLAAGAAAGALGCIAAATLIAPVAIASLPMWSAIGAALAALVPSTGKNITPQPMATDAVRAAALFAILLELQGRGEASITRILDQTLVDDATFELGNAREWLDQLRHRLDLAIARESLS